MTSQVSQSSRESKGLAALGLVRHAEGDDEAARDHAQQALENGPQRFYLGQGDSALVLGHALACLTLGGGEPAQALIHANEILGHLETHSLDGTYEPFRIYWTCYRILKAHDGRAAEVLRTACCILQGRATGIKDDDVRRTFLEGVPAHRTLVQEYHRLRAGGLFPGPHRVP